MIRNAIMMLFLITYGIHAFDSEFIFSYTGKWTLILEKKKMNHIAGAKGDIYSYIGKAEYRKDMVATKNYYRIIPLNVVSLNCLSNFKTGDTIVVLGTLMDTEFGAETGEINVIDIENCKNR